MALTKVTRSGITDNSINAAKIEDGTVVDADITPGTITPAKLNATLDISSKTVTLPNTSVTNGMLAGSIANAKLANSSITVNGSAIALGGSVNAGSISWQAVKTSGFTAVAGEGYFCNTNGGAFTATLPASPSAGDTVAFKDYGDDFATNSLTIGRNGKNIQGVANDSEITTDRASVICVFIDNTKGWLFTNESNVADLQKALYVTATGGTVSTVDTNFKVHTFTGDGNFVVSQAGNAVGSNKFDYLVIAGGGSNGPGHVGGGAGAGGYRESHSAPVSGPYTASPLATPTSLTAAAQTYPVTVGGGGNNPSTISTITSTAGGGGGNSSTGPNALGKTGGSGGGGGGHPGGSTPTLPALPGGAGNTPPVSPPQGNNGGTGNTSSDGPGGNAGGGGGAGAVGANMAPGTGGNGGAGVASAITGSSVTRAGGGGGSTHSQTPGTGGSGGGGNGSKYSPSVLGTNGAANTGGGAGGDNLPGRSGGSGIVVVRYKFQN